MAKEINEKVIEAAKILSNVSKSTDDRRLYQARMQKYADIISLYESGLEEGEQARKNKAASKFGIEKGKKLRSRRRKKGTD